MKKIFILVLIFICFKASAQVPNNYIPQKSYNKFYGLYADSVLHIPTGCGFPSLLTTKSWKGGAAIYADTCNNKLYFYRDTAWVFIPDSSYLINSSIDSLFGLQDNTPTANRQFGQSNLTPYSFNFRNQNLWSVDTSRQFRLRSYRATDGMMVRVESGLYGASTLKRLFTSAEDTAYLTNMILDHDHFTAEVYRKYISTSTPRVGFYIDETEASINSATSQFVTFDAVQNNVGIGTTSTAASSVLDLTSTSKGFLPPRMTAAQRAAISSPATGLVVYDTDTTKISWYNGSGWVFPASTTQVGGSTPTLQQVLTAGATLTSGNTIVNGANTLTLTGNSIAGASIFSVTSNSTAAASNAQKGINISMTGANSNSSQYTYGIYSSNAHTGTSSTNVAGSFEASNGTTNIGVDSYSYGSGYGVGGFNFGTGDGVYAVNSNGSGSGRALYAVADRSGATTAIGAQIEASGATNNYAIIVPTGKGYVGFGTSTPTSLLHLVGGRLQLPQGADVASVAGAIALGDDGNSFEITGTNAITRISNVGWQNGSEVTLWFTSTASLTDGTANSGTDIGMELAGNTNFTGSAGASLTLQLIEIGGTQRWREKARSVN